MDWFKIAQALLLVAMLFMLYQRVKQALKNPPQESSNNWGSVIMPLLIVAIIVAALISFVK